MVSRPRPYAPEREIDRILTRVDRVENGAPLVSTSVTNGRTRFVGPESWKLEGSGTVEGLLTVIGEMLLAGDFTVDGGTITIPGATPITIRTQGGQAQIALGGSTLSGYGSAGAALVSGDHQVSVTNIEAAMTGTSAQMAVRGDDGYIMVPPLDASDVGAWLGRHKTSGKLGWVDSSTGGPTGSGLFRWPFDLSTVSKEFDTTDPSYSPPGHRGIDFSIAGGIPIPAAGNGTVEGVGFDSERGYFVILNHGTRDGKVITTRYYHLQEPSPLSVGDVVAKSDTVGLVGTTGSSTGNHLHFETRYDGVAENPRAVMSVYGE